MKANITKRLACTLLALAVMITTVFVHVESAQAAERYTYAYKSTDNETAYAGTEVKLDGEEYIIVRQNDILAVVE